MLDFNIDSSPNAWTDTSLPGLRLKIGGTGKRWTTEILARVF